jgi:hypothetical protein
MDRKSLYRLFGLVLPLIALAIAGTVAASQYFRLRSLEDEQARTERSLEFVRKLITEMQTQPHIEKVAAVAKSPDEQAVFLDQLRQYALEKGVDLSRWANVHSVPQPGSGGTEMKAPTGPEPVVSTIEVSGEFENVRAFLYTIVRAPRLLNLTNLRWTRQDGDKPNVTRVSFTLTRYVSKDATPAMPVSASSTIPTEATQ